MEVLLCFLVNTFVWVISFTLCLPVTLALIFNKALRQKVFSVVYVFCVCGIFNNRLADIRRKTLELLHVKTKDRDKSKMLKVLEIGIGPGYNLPFYPENTSLIALDKSVDFGSFFLKNRKKFPQVRLERLVNCMAENMDTIEDGSMDAVIGTYVFCSVQSIETVLKEIIRVLKPGGHFVFLEHIAFPRSEWGYVIQRQIGFLWYLWTDGCCCHNEGVIDKISKAGFSDVQHEIVCYNKVPLYGKQQLVGIATK